MSGTADRGKGKGGQSKKANTGRPRREPAVKRNRRMPPTFDPARPTPQSGHIGGGEHAKRLRDFLELKVDPFGKSPDFAGAFSRVIAGFPDEAFSDEAALISHATRPASAAEAFFPGLPTDETARAGLQGLADAMEQRKQGVRDDIGSLMVCAVEHFTADQAESFFKTIVEMKRKLENPPHRNAWAHAAYSDFIAEFGFEPSKAGLRKYISQGRRKYPDPPGRDDIKGWTRLWTESGLSALADG
jgi:hypothetical protein